MKRRMVVLVLFMVLGISCDPSGTFDSAAIEGYLPLASGNSWYYDVHVVGEGVDTTEPMSVTLSGPYMFDSIAWYGANDFCVEKTPLSPLPLFCAAWGTHENQVLFIRNGPGPARFDPEVLLDFPLWVGKSWLTKASVDTSYTTTSGERIVMKHTSRRTYRGQSTMLVPAGLFPGCIEIADTTLDLYWYKPAGQDPVTEYYSLTCTSEWYAKDVGMVKQVVATIMSPDAAPSRMETHTLTKYTVK